MTTHRSAHLSAMLAVLASAGALAMVATTSTQRLAIGVALVGLLPVALALESRYRGHSLAGLLLGVLGVTGLGGAIFIAVTQFAALSHTLELLPGLLGLYVLVMGVEHFWSGRDRLLISVGTGLVLVSIITSAAVYEAMPLAVVGGGLLTVLSWDLAEQALNLGEQVGREPSTRSVELLHAGGTAGVGCLAFGAVVGIDKINVSGVPLVVLVGLLGAGFTLALGLYN